MTRSPFPPERWRHVEEVFHAAVELPVDQRAAFLHQSCVDDEATRREVETLLAADDEESPLIAGIIDHATVTLLLDGDLEPGE